MLELEIKPMSFFNEETCEFIDIDGKNLKLEHSLMSLSKWESKWHKPFINNKDKTKEETIDYIRCMTINKEYIDPLIYNYMSSDNIKKINDYIDDPMTATWFKERPGAGGRREILTAELIYYYMTIYGIPFSCEKWHINRLLTLIRVCNEKEEGNNKKMSKREIMSQNRSLNAARRRRLNTRG